MPQRLSATARRLLADHIHSVLMLELLLLLHRDPAMAWSAADAARELRAPEAWVAAQLAGFAALELVAHDVPAGTYHFRDAAPGAAAVAEIAAAFRQRKTTIINMIFASRPSDLASFSDAFRLRGDE